MKRTARVLPSEEDSYAGQRKTETTETPRDIYVKPIVAFFKAIGLFLDVATLMIRLLFNTIAR